MHIYNDLFVVKMEKPSADDNSRYVWRIIISILMVIDVVFIVIFSMLMNSVDVYFILMAVAACAFPVISPIFLYMVWPR